MRTSYPSHKYCSQRLGSISRIEDIRKEPARWQSLQWTLNLGLVLFECLPHIPSSGDTLGSCPWMVLSSLKDRHYSNSSKWKNPRHLKVWKNISKQALRCGSTITTAVLWLHHVHIGHVAINVSKKIRFVCHILLITFWSKQCSF